MCYDEDIIGTTTPSPGLDPCGHHVCRVCLRTWAKQCERRGKIRTPCPYCKEPVAGELVEHALGRPYQPGTTGCSSSADPRQSSGEEEDDDDDELRGWLEANHAQRCGHCGVWVLREGGCRSMMCLCGHRWCWTCRVPLLSTSEDTRHPCACRHNIFYDNASRRERRHVPRRASPDELRYRLGDFLAQRRQQEVTETERQQILSQLMDPDNLSDLFDTIAEDYSDVSNGEEEEEEEERVVDADAGTPTDNGASSNGRHGRKWRRPGILTARFWMHRWRRGNNPRRRRREV